MEVDVANSELQWRIYRKKLEMELFQIRWHQSKSLQQTPRFTRTEGSPIKTNNPATRGALRRSRGPPTAYLDYDRHVEADDAARTASTPYRLPRLPGSLNSPEKPKDYVYKQPLTASHFLLRKDPRRSTPVPECTSPELRIKPSSTKCRPITQSVRHKILYQSWPQEGVKLHRLLPKISQPRGVIVLTEGQPIEPKTPPQSEAEYTMLPSLPKNTDESTTTSGQIQHSLAPYPVTGDAIERKLNWQLSPYSNNNFDRQGLGPNQGPFSRELPIKCMPPNNWLRMKLRQRLTTK